MYTTIHDSKHYIYLVIHQFAAVFGQTPITATGDGFVSSFFLFLSLQSPFPSTHTLTHKRTHTQVHVRDLTWPHDTTERKARGPWVAVSGHAPLHVPGCVSARAPWSKVWFWLSGTCMLECAMDFLGSGLVCSVWDQLSLLSHPHYRASKLL